MLTIRLMFAILNVRVRDSCDLIALRAAAKTGAWRRGREKITNTQNSRRVEPARPMEERMTPKRAFISFDYDHDNDLRGNLVAQANRSDSPFSIADRSVRASIDENWRNEVRDRIRRVDVVIVICGEHTHDAAGVAAEISIAQEERKPYFLLRGRRRRTCTRPRNARSSDEMHPWRWDTLRRLITGQG